MSLGGSEPVGVIGVGAMGGAVARRLAGLGLSVHVRDPRREAIEALQPAKVVVCGSPATLAGQCQTLVILVVDADQIEEVLFGTDGAVAHLKPGALVMLSSTIAPLHAQSFVSRLAALGVHALDAPVSGGPGRAEQGTMSVMLAATPEARARGQGLLQLLSNNVIQVGDRPGDGARYKLLNNLMAAANLAVGAEVMALGLKMGLDGNHLLQVAQRSSGSSWVLGDRMPRALAGDFEPRAATRILTKDVSLFMDLARSEDFPALLGSQVLQVFQAAVANGWAERDDAALLPFYQQLCATPE